MTLLPCPYCGQMPEKYERETNAYNIKVGYRCPIHGVIGGIERVRGSVDRYVDGDDKKNNIDRRYKYAAIQYNKRVKAIIEYLKKHKEHES